MSIARKFGAVIVLTCALAWGSSAAAQATRTWVSGVGDDANPCSRTAPCKTFAGAISKTAAGGEINTLDPGGFGALTITKSITIATDPSMGGILSSSTNGIVINAGVNDNIVLRGLTIQGGGTAVNGIRFQAGKSLTLQNCYFTGNNTAFPNGIGLNILPSSGSVSLTISDSFVYNNGLGADGGGIVIQPTGTASVQAALSNVTANGNTVGLRADASQTSGVVRVTITDSLFSGNTNGGVSALTLAGFGFASVSLEHVTSSNNGSGLNANGPNTTLRFGSSTVVGNGVGIQQVNGGVAQSYGNNVIGNISGNDGSWATLPLR